MAGRGARGIRGDLIDTPSCAAVRWQKQLKALLLSGKWFSETAERLTFRLLSANLNFGTLRDSQTSAGSCILEPYASSFAYPTARTAIENPHRLNGFPALCRLSGSLPRGGLFYSRVQRRLTSCCHFITIRSSTREKTKRYGEQNGKPTSQNKQPLPPDLKG